jgi:hypothetical protein
MITINLNSTKPVIIRYYNGNIYVYYNLFYHEHIEILTIGCIFLSNLYYKQAGSIITKLSYMVLFIKTRLIC